MSVVDVWSDWERGEKMSSILLEMYPFDAAQVASSMNRYSLLFVKTFIAAHGT